MDVRLRLFGENGTPLSLATDSSDSGSYPVVTDDPRRIRGFGCLVFNTGCLRPSMADGGVVIFGSAIASGIPSPLNGSPAIIGASVAFEQEPGSFDLDPEALPTRSIPTFGCDLRTMSNR